MASAFFLIVASGSDSVAGEAKSHLLGAKIEELSSQVEAKCVAWRRDIHQNPELSWQEVRTGKLVAEHLKGLGLEVKTGVGKNGVVGVLRGKKDKPVVALRADMDALPVTEAVDLPFASKVKTQYEGKEVGVMHACGHDAHTAILMATAEVLSKLKGELPGTVVFLFQPAEERGEGAAEMIREGALDSPKPDAIFGLHVNSAIPLGEIGYRSRGFLASSDLLKITIQGKQTHGAYPWMGVDPIVAAAQVILGLQTIVSRQTDLTASAAVISIGSIQGGVRFNIIPDQVEMSGSIRALDPRIQKEMHERIQRTTRMVAESSGAKVEVSIKTLAPVTYNDPDLTSQMIPTLERVVGKGKAILMAQQTGSEDFSYYQEKLPGLYFFLGITPEGEKVVPMHSPHLIVDERALIVGIRVMAHLAMDYLASH
ncbi:MAG: amidohydrolase [candidate division NC10 bacterium]|nr:amidohydrolase [candidate division NC10 bacterium]